MRKSFEWLSRHWGKALVVLALLAGGAAYAASPLLRDKSHDAWNAALVWAGIGGEPVDTGKVFWCPMHPQIKSKKENAVCPICNMALVELEGGVVEPPEHLTLTAQQVQQAGVVTQPVMRRALYRPIDTTGRIDYDERRLAKITSWIRGKSRIEKLYVSFMGQHVEQGEPLAEFYSPDLFIAQREYLSHLRALAGQTSSALDSDLLQSARQKLKNQGLSDAQVDRLQERRQPLDTIPIYSPISGTVIKRHVQERQYVSEGDVLFEVADLSQLWLFADVYEDEWPLVQVGTPVELSVSSLPGETFSGTVAFIDPMVRPATRTVPVRIDVDNRDRRLLPGMFAGVRLRHEFPAALAVPENAILWSGQRAVALVKRGEGTFEPREVRLGHKWLYSQIGGSAATGALGFGSEQVRYHEVLAGLAPGEEVVTAGAFLLSAESQFQSVLAKMLPPESQQATLEQIVGQPVAEQMRAVLEAYFNLSETLAGDRLHEVPMRMAAVSAAAGALVEAGSDADAAELRADARKFQELVAALSAEPPIGAVDARTRFGRISHELTKLLAEHGGKALFGSELYQFECGMAKVGYERWLWWSPEIHNPYMGQKMLTCGKKLDVLEP